MDPSVRNRSRLSEFDIYDDKSCDCDFDDDYEYSFDDELNAKHDRIDLVWDGDPDDIIFNNEWFNRRDDDGYDDDGYFQVWTFNPDGSYSDSVVDGFYEDDHDATHANHYKSTRKRVPCGICHKCKQPIKLHLYGDTGTIPCRYISFASHRR